MTEAKSLEGGFRTPAEAEEGKRNEACFARNPQPWDKKLENFPKYVRRQNLTRFIALYEIFKRVINVKGSVVECGVFQGFGVMSWAKFSAILEPLNLMRRIYGFDTFAGFPTVSKRDRTRTAGVTAGGLYADSHEELTELIATYDSTRALGHVTKVELIRGDASQTIPAFIASHPSLLVSLLFMDFDLYEPTKVALEHFVPRMPRGAVIAFDELDNPLWPGETAAMLEFFGDHKLKIERLPFDPYIGFAVIE